jgi:hypothetical protein
MIENAFVYELKNDSDIDSYISGRVYRDPAPESKQFDCIIYSPISLGNWLEYNRLKDIFTFYICTKSRSNNIVLLKKVKELFNFEYSDDYGSSTDSYTLIGARILDTNPTLFFDEKNKVYISQADISFDYFRK